MEKWKWIEGYEGRYKISTYGRVRTFRFLEPVLLRTFVSSRGYLVADIHPRKLGQTRQVHRLVAEAFLPNPENNPLVHHRDHNRQNPHLSNLEWVTASQNTRYAYQAGRMVSPLLKKFGELAPSAKLKEHQVLAIRAAQMTGRTIRSLAREYNISDHAISDIFTRHSWKHI